MKLDSTHVPLPLCLDATQTHILAHPVAEYAEFCSPEAWGDPMLLEVDDDGDESFNKNSSMAEGKHSWIHGTSGRCRSDRVVRAFVRGISLHSCRTET